MSQERLIVAPENPRPELKGIEQALNRGNHLHGFRSGSGLRVVRIEKEGRLTGYGEHPSVDEALLHADEDFIAGGKPYNEVYGPKYPHYLTGSSEVTSRLDGWLLQGHTFDAYKTKGGNVVFELKGLKYHETPQEVYTNAKAGGQPVVRQDRGYTYETRYDPHLFPNGDEGWSTRTVGIPEGGNPHRDTMYYILKTGEGNSFNEAMDKAFEAPEIEIPDNF